MNGSGMSGFWQDAWDATLDAGHPILRQLAAEKLMREGIIPSVNAPAIVQPSFYVGSQTAAAAQLTPAPTSQGANNGANLGMMAVALVVVLILLGR